uniref:Putative ovule protein n=1 Tax=Solanum chacoense TaxID=4108 RepID=A0A0V0GMN7_SOLCH
MTSLVRNTPLRFSRRVDGYEPLDQPESTKASMQNDEDRSHSVRRTIMKLKRSVKQRSSPIMLSSISYRRERARKRNIFLQSYKLESSKNLRKKKLKKIVLKVKCAMISVFSL